MKKTLILFLITTAIAFAQKEERSSLLIPPKQTEHIDYPLYQGFNVKIWNTSKFELGIASRDKRTDSVQQRRSLDKGESITFEINPGMYLEFENRFLTPLKVEFTLRKGTTGNKKTVEPLTPQRAFYLENNTAQTIPLVIPGIMNPKLTPFSRSGVNLVNGQKVYLDLNGERILILTVTDSIPHGARIDLATLINQALNKEQ